MKPVTLIDKFNICNAGVVLVVLSAMLPATAQAQENWTFNLTPYIWFAGVDGESSTIPPLPAAPIEVSPSDAVEDTEVSYMAMFSATKGRHGVLVDFIYADVRTDEELVEELGLNLRATSKSTLASLAYVYQFYAESDSQLDVFAGARYWDVETVLKFSGGQGLLDGRRVDNAEDWIDPLLGLKGRKQLGDSRFYLAGWASMGGFGGGSDLFYDLSLSLGYQWSEAIGTTLGYRLLDVDYEKDGFLYDIEQSGVTLGLTWRF